MTKINETVSLYVVFLVYNKHMKTACLTFYLLTTNFCN